MSVQVWDTCIAYLVKATGTRMFDSPIRGIPVHHFFYPGFTTSKNFQINIKGMGELFTKIALIVDLENWT